MNDGQQRLWHTGIYMYIHSGQNWSKHLPYLRGFSCFEVLRKYTDTMPERCAAPIVANVDITNIKVGKKSMIHFIIFVVHRAKICMFHEHWGIKSSFGGKKRSQYVYRVRTIRRAQQGRGGPGWVFLQADQNSQEAKRERDGARLGKVLESGFNSGLL